MYQVGIKGLGVIVALSIFSGCTVAQQTTSQTPTETPVNSTNGIMLTGWHPNLTERPRLGAKPGDREKMQHDIRTNGPGKKRYLSLKKRVDPYIAQHEKDPDYLMSRMMMNWGAHYTHFPAFGESKRLEFKNFNSPYKPSKPCIMDKFRGRSLDMRKLSGHAPVPTMRVGFSSGGTAPKLGKIDAYNGDLFKFGNQYLPMGGTGITKYFQGIADLAADAATLYYWTGDERYARFACDYFMQWVLAIHFQNPFNRPKARVGNSVISNVTTGLNGMDITAGYTKRMSWVYDFCYDYLQKHERHYLDGKFYHHRKGEVDYAALKKAMAGKKINEVIDGVLFKFMYYFIMETVLVGDINSPNNHCIWSQQGMDYFLAIEDNKLRAKGMDIILYSDELCKKTTWGYGYHGSLSLRTQVKNAFTEDGFWKESTAYQGIATGRTVNLMNCVERQGYNPWKDCERLLKSPSARFRIMFPNRTLAAYGDSGRVSHTRSGIHHFYRSAKKHNLPGKDELAKLYRWAADNGFASPSKEELAELPKKGESPLTRTDRVDYVPLYLQRINGLDKMNGLMSTLYGGGYTHCQPEGINFEFYAKGIKPVAHAGYFGYGSPLHSGWCMKIGSKNTVIPGDLPLNNRDVGRGKYDLKLHAMEPAPRTEAVSPNMSFIEVGIPYGGRQRRCMALIRTSKTTGYLVDVFRSSNAKSNEYRLHSIGQSVRVYENAGVMPLKRTNDLTNSKLGDNFLQDKMKSVTPPNGDLKAVFAIKDKTRDLEFNVFMPGRKDYTIYTFTGVQRGSAEAPFNKMRSPGIAVRLNGEAWNRPFTAVYEISQRGASSITSVKRLSDGAFTALEIKEKTGKRLVLSSESPDRLNTCAGCRFKGTFAVVAESGNNVELYLGKGSELSNAAYSIKSVDGSEISTSLRIKDGKAAIRSTGPCDVVYQGQKHRVQPNTPTEL